MRRRHAEILTTALFFVTIATPHVSGQCLRYTVDIIPGPTCPFVGSSAAALGINEMGELCGGYTPCAKGVSGASVWLGTRGWLTLPPPSVGIWYQAYDVNSSRLVAGNILTNPNTSIYRAAVANFNNGTVTDIGVLPDHFQSEAYAVNEDSVVCGYSSGSAGLRAVVWNSAQITALNLPLGPNSVAKDISDTNLVCGWMGYSRVDDAHAFIHHITTGNTLDIGTPLPGSTNAEATAVNESGNVCGWSYFPCGKFCYTRQGFFWSGGVVENLGTLPGLPNCIPKDLNDSNDVVGFCFGQSGSFATGFVWKGGVMHRLTDFVYPPHPTLHIEIAHAINNAGQIAGEAQVGTNIVAVRLTPVPPIYADITCDWLVNHLDLMEVINNWGPASPAPPVLPNTPSAPADITGDGAVNVSDLLAVINHWTF